MTQPIMAMATCNGSKTSDYWQWHRLLATAMTASNSTLATALTTINSSDF